MNTTLEHGYIETATISHLEPLDESRLPDEVRMRSMNVYLRKLPGTPSKDPDKFGGELEGALRFEKVEEGSIPYATKGGVERVEVYRLRVVDEGLELDQEELHRISSLFDRGEYVEEGKRVEEEGYPKLTLMINIPSDPQTYFTGNFDGVYPTGVARLIVQPDANKKDLKRQEIFASLISDKYGIEEMETSPGFPGF